MSTPPHTPPHTPPPPPPGTPPRSPLDADRHASTGAPTGPAPRAAGARVTTAEVRAALRSLRIRARLLLLTRDVGWLFGAGVAVVTLAAFVDYVLRFPTPVRVVAWALGVALLGAWVVRAFGRLRAFRPSLTDLALRVERSPDGRAHGLPGLLASSLELEEELAASHPPGRPVTEGLARLVIAEAAGRFRGVRAASILVGAHARRAVLAALLVGAGVATYAVIEPGLVATGAQRILWPFAGAQWPKRTALADATSAAVHPLGVALPLRAVVTRTDAPEGQTRVWARYRLVSNEGASPLERVLLVSQGRRAAAPGPQEGERVEGELFERLVEAVGMPGTVGGPARVELEYWFESRDDRTPARRVALVEAPAVASADAVVRPPAYAGPAPAGFVAGAIELGAGSDERAVVRPILAGSTVEMTIHLNKPVPAPRAADLAAGEPAALAWAASTFGGAFDPRVASLRAEPTRWTLAWTAAAPARLPVTVYDEHGLHSADEAVFSFEVAEDRLPGASVTDPARDERVLPTAVIRAEGEGRDDVGLVRVALLAQPASPPTGSDGAPPEPRGEERLLASGGDGAREVRLPVTLDLSQFDLSPRDELWLIAAAADGFEHNGATREEVRSAPRRLRIISDAELVEEVRAELSQVRAAAIRIDEEQAELRRAVESGWATADNLARQGSIAERARRQQETAETLARRVERNRLADESMHGLLMDAADLLADAGRAADRAAAALDAAVQADAPEDAAPDRARAAQAADEVRQNLAAVIDLLDRGEDTWVVRRGLERLIEEQRAAQAQTRALGERLGGQRPEDLSRQDADELERLAQRQEELARQAAEAIESMAERGEQLRQADPGEAAALSQAAERGERQQVAERLERAGEQIRRNQTQSASASQQEAVESLERMLRDLEDTQRSRDEMLRRVLADLVQSLRGLVTSQARELSRLAAASGALTGLDAGMIALHANTIATADAARASGREVRAVTDLLDRAGESQQAAIVALRPASADADAADRHERASLGTLREALAEAERLQSQARAREQARQRRELRSFYREALEKQAALRAEAAAFVGKPIDRRERARVRALGERQESLRQELGAQREELSGSAEARLFTVTHDRLDRELTQAAGTLRAGSPDAATLARQDSALRLLAALVEALEPPQRDDEFQDRAAGGEPGSGEGAGGEGAPGQGLIPPVAELKLLRELLVEAAERTRTLHELGGGAPAEALADLVRTQRELTEQARALVERLQQRPDAGAPAEPGAEPGAGDAGPDGREPPL